MCDVHTFFRVVECSTAPAQPQHNLPSTPNVRQQLWTTTCMHDHRRQQTSSRTTTVSEGPLLACNRQCCTIIRFCLPYFRRQTTNTPSMVHALECSASVCFRFAFVLDMGWYQNTPPRYAVHVHSSTLQQRGAETGEVGGGRSRHVPVLYSSV